MFLKSTTICFAAIMLVSTVLSGCAYTNSIHRHSAIHKNGQIEYIDAKQRAILAAPFYKYEYETYIDQLGVERDVIKNGRRVPKLSSKSYKFCSEPPPDALSAYATSSSAKVNKEKGVGLGGAFGLSSSEAAATIEHTQTVNLIRETFFRTCERYMNGALDDDEMSIQTARDQRTMVATLAIEQLTGVVKRQPTILTTESVAAFSDESKDIIEKLTKAEGNVAKFEKEIPELKTASEGATAAYAALNKAPEEASEGAPKFCDAAIDAENAKEDETLAGGLGQDAGVEAETPKPDTPESDTPTATAEELEACKKARDDAKNKAAALAEKEAELVSEKSEVQKQERLLKHLETTVLATKAGGSGDSGSDRASEAHLEKVADTVEAITLAAFNDQSEILFTCKKIVVANTVFDDNSMQALCGKMMLMKFAIDAQIAAGKKPTERSTKAYIDFLSGDVDALKFIPGSNPNRNKTPLQ